MKLVQRLAANLWPALKRRLVRDWRGAAISAVLAIAVGVALWLLPIGQGWVHLSYDLLFLFRPTIELQEIVLVEMDEQSHRQLGQTYGQMWDRALHARLLDRLRADQSGLVLFDVWLADSGTESTDRELARAIQNHGKVVLAADLSPIAQRGVVGNQTLRPKAEFSKAAAAWGIAKVLVDEDSTVRRHYSGSENDPSLPWAAAQLAGAAVAKSSSERMAERWLNHYGPYGTLPRVSYHAALRQPAGIFSNKFVVVGGRPLTRFTAEEVDEFKTPYTRKDGQVSSGMEIEATSFLNLLRGDWLVRPRAAVELGMLVSAGLLAGCLLGYSRPMVGTGLALLTVVALGCSSVWLFLDQRIWFPWLLIAGAQVPCSWIWSILYHARKMQQEKEVLQALVAQVCGTGPKGGPVPQTAVMPPDAKLPRVPVGPGAAMAQVPDHELIRCVGRGAYGEVWVARDAIQTYHAVKIVYRDRFREEAPYDREFRGVQKFTPISRQHPGLLHILHVGRNDAAGYFYYVMEAADDERTGQDIQPERYMPKTLSAKIRERKQIPLEECLELAIQLGGALDFLHQRGLIHRDIKPANILFVGGNAKLADIGLVTEMASNPGEVTLLGTEGYMAPEGPGTAAADIYGLGKVIYEAGMGRDRHEFPEPPSFLSGREDRTELGELGKILFKACHDNPNKRHKSAAQLQSDLARLLKRIRSRKITG